MQTLLSKLKIAGLHAGTRDIRQVAPGVYRHGHRQDIAWIWLRDDQRILRLTVHLGNASGGSYELVDPLAPSTEEYPLGGKPVQSGNLAAGLSLIDAVRMAGQSAEGLQLSGQAERSDESDEIALAAEELADGWSVSDGSGQRWWPDEATAAEILAAADPAAQALEICRTDPMRGRWHC